MSEKSKCVFDEEKVTERFKMVRPGFKCGALWDERVMKKNEVCRAPMV